MRGETLPLPDMEAGAVPRGVMLAFAPIHKRAFGIAIGTVVGVLVFGVTAFHRIANPQDALNIALLDQYFYGYAVSWPGAAIGALWGFFSGFVAGWFIAFCRNVALGMLLFIGKTRGELAQTRDFLDHI
jgi:hypothetical protein